MKGDKLWQIQYMIPSAVWTLTPRPPLVRLNTKGQTYYFCSLGCKKAFDNEPERYLGKADEHTHQH
jgi:Cu+-exporting ATPase